MVISKRGRGLAAEFSIAEDKDSGLDKRKKSTTACSKREIAKASMSGLRVKMLLWSIAEF
jgi:hypothetical protein